MPRAKPPVHRTAGVVLAALATLLIAAVTLDPQPVPAFVPFGHTCLVCGGAGWADVVANVALFAPLGAALVLAGVPWWVASLVGCGFSTSIELAQLLVIPGRYATLSDVVTNSTGTVLGALVTAGRGFWLRPAGWRAWGLTAVGAGLFLGVITGGGWALGGLEDESSTPPRIDVPPVPTMMGWFAGRVLSASLGDYTATNRGSGPVTMTSPAHRDVRADVVVAGVDRRPNRLALLFVHRAGESDPWLELAVEGRALLLEPGLRGRRLRLRQPVVTVLRRTAREPELGMPYRFASAVTGDRLTIAFEQGYTRRVETMRLSPTLGWTLFSPYPRANAPLAGLATALWVAGLTLALGYWARWAARGTPATRGAAAVAVAATLGCGLAVVPTMAGFAVARWWEWGAAVAGVATGAALAEAMRRTGERRAGARGVSLPR